MTITINDCRTKHLFLLIGGNTLPNYVAARLLAHEDTVLYFVYSEDKQRPGGRKFIGTHKQYAALVKTLALDSTTAPNVMDIPVDESNPSRIRSEIARRMYSIPKHETVGLHYTGGTKTMAVHAYRALYEDKNRTGHRCYTYLDARTLHLWIERSDWGGVQAIFAGDKLNVSLRELLLLHGREELREDMRTEAIWPSVALGLAEVNNKEGLRKEWTTLWNTFKKSSEKLLCEAMEEHSTDIFAAHSDIETLVYRPLQNEVPHPFPLKLVELVKRSPFAKADEPCRKTMTWFTGGWLEDYTYLVLQDLATRYTLHDIALNIKPKLGNRDFEFDVACMRGYQLFAFSCGLARGRKECKAKFLEAVARARQLGGTEARIALVCCINDPGDLQNEVDALVGNDQVRVFGQRDILQLRERIEKWLQDLDVLTGAP